MTEQERTLAKRAIDEAYGEQIGQLFSVLCKAAEDEIKNGIAVERFMAGLRKAISCRKLAMEAGRTIDKETDKS